MILKNWKKNLLHIPLKKNFQCLNKNGSQKNLKKINTLNLLKYSRKFSVFIFLKSFWEPFLFGHWKFFLKGMRSKFFFNFFQIIIYNIKSFFQICNFFLNSLSGSDLKNSPKFWQNAKIPFLEQILYDYNSI